MRCTRAFALSQYASIVVIFGLILFLFDLVECAANRSDKKPSREAEIVVTQARGKSTIARIGQGINGNVGTQYRPSTEISVQRHIDDWTLADFLLIATVDGSLHACERSTGNELWVLPGEGSVVKATKNNQSEDSKSMDDVTWIVEPLGKGALYYFTTEHGLQKLPVTIEQLVLESPLKISGDTNHYTGMRQSRMYSVDARTGKILKTYGTGAAAGSCKNPNRDLELEDDDEWDSAFTSRQTFMVGRTEYRLEIESDEGVVWNVSYTSWGPNNMDADLAIQHCTSPDNLYVYSSHDGSVYGVDYNNEGRTWAKVLSSPAITAFDVFSSYDAAGTDGELVVLPQPVGQDPMYDVVKTGDTVSTFVNRTKDGGWYALSEQNYPFLVRRAPVALWNLGVLPLASEDQHHSLIGVHDGQRPKEGFAHYRIEGSARESISDNESQRSPTFNSQPMSLPLRAVVDLSLAVPIILAAYFLLRMQSVRDFFSLASSESFDSTNLITKVGDMPSAVVTPIDSTVSDDKAVDLTFAEADNEENENVEGVTSIGGDTENNQTTVKKRKRGARGGRRNGNKVTEKDKVKTVVVVEDHTKKPVDEKLPSIEDVLESDKEMSSVYKVNALEVTDTVLGYGSHGTVVYKGTFENREVAVKRMLLDFYDVASHEVSLLQESDDHPNVVRYFCKQQSQRFLYIALELCPATLQDVIDRPSEFSELVDRMDPPKVLYQIANGVQYLHSLKIVHRDLKPQNILVAPPKRLRVGGSDSAPARLLISDFGLCKKLEGDQSSFRATTAHAAGTSGWRAPELLVDDDDSGAGTSSSSHTIGAQTGSTSEPAVIDTLSNRRATRAIDIFSLGCVFYYVLSNGAHPFGDRYMREANIIRGKYSLDFLEALGYQGVEAKDLIERMLDRNPGNRPSAADVMIHPYFWSAAKRLNFLLEVSDRFEIERRDPPSELLMELESDPQNVVYNDWYKRLDKSLLDNLGKYRKYHADKVLDLLRALRNKKHHYQDLPSNVQLALGSMPDGFLAYFTQRFPNLLLHVYYVVRNNLRDEPHFRPYFSLTT